MSVLHATTLARRVDGEWRGVLVRGHSGVGKSDLALRAWERGWRLVADDRTLVWMSAGLVYGRAPDPIIGLIEARGVGLVAIPALPFVRLALVVDAAEGSVERMPEPERVCVLQADLPRLRFDLFEASTLIKIGLMLEGYAALGDDGRL